MPNTRKSVEERSLLHDGLPIIILMAAWSLMTIIANPIGNFPLNDDWAYAESVKQLIETHHFNYPDWSASNIITQIFWGAAFSHVFGHSYTTLRASTLVLGIIGVIFTYLIIRQQGASKAASLIAGLCIAANPIYFASSNTFMTDVPFFTFSAISIFFLSKNLHQASNKNLILGTTASVAALMIRQLGFAIPIAYLIAFIFKNKMHVKSMASATAPLLTCLLAQSYFNYWLAMDGQKPTMRNHQINLIDTTLHDALLPLLYTLTTNTLHILPYLALFTAPILFIVAIDHYSVKNHLKPFLLWILPIWAVYRLFKIKSWPHIGNVLGKYGIGPSLQYGAHGYYASPKIIWSLLWKLITVASFISMIFLCHFLWHGAKNIISNKSINPEQHQRLTNLVFFGAITIIYITPILALPVIFDRYLLLPTMTLMACIILTPVHLQQEPSPRQANIYALALICVVGLITAAMTHDYLEWNRVRWHALNELVLKEHISPDKIDGGFEFNGTYLYSNKHPTFGANGWWVVDNEYLIAFEKSAFEGKYQEEKKYHAHTWLPFSPRQILVLHRS